MYIHVLGNERFVEEDHCPACAQLRTYVYPGCVVNIMRLKYSCIYLPIL